MSEFYEVVQKQIDVYVTNDEVEHATKKDAIRYVIANLFRNKSVVPDEYAGDVAKFLVGDAHHQGNWVYELLKDLHEP